MDREIPGGAVVSDAGLPSGLRELGGGRGVYIFKRKAAGLGGVKL